jgi:hypothetical protein
MLEPDKCRSNGLKWSCGKPEVSFRAGGQPGSYPETGLGEINGDLLESDFLGVEAPFDDHSTLFSVLIVSM